MLTRRTALTLGLAVPGLAGLAACGPNASSGSSGSDGGGSADSGSLRLAWWGNPTRNENTEKVVAAYGEKTPDVKISLEPGEWSGYWDKLATQTAGGDFPDVVQMDEKYLSEYAGRGALLDLAGAGLDTSKFVDGSVEVGEVKDVGLAAINAGLNAFTVLANPDVFDAAGVDIPDDTTWTWDDMIETAQKITEATDDGTYGMTQMGTVQGLFQLWVRQAGQDQYKDGKAGFDAKAATAWFEWSKKIQDTKAGPGADASVEDSTAAKDQTLFGTGKIAMTVAWSNQVVANDALHDGKLKVLRPPSTTGSAAEAKLWYKASMYWAVSAKTGSPAAAVAFVDYLDPLRRARRARQPRGPRGDHPGPRRVQQEGRGLPRRDREGAGRRPRDHPAGRRPVRGHPHPRRAGHAVRHDLPGRCRPASARRPEQRPVLTHHGPDGRGGTGPRAHRPVPGAPPKGVAR